MNILLDKDLYLVSLCKKVHLKDKVSLTLACYLFNRFLCIKQVSLDKVRLVAVGCLDIACHLYETDPPKLNDWRIVTERACKRKDIIRVKKIILSALCFDVELRMNANGKLANFLYFLTFYIPEVCFSYSPSELYQTCRVFASFIRGKPVDFDDHTQTMLDIYRVHLRSLRELLEQECFQEEAKYKKELFSWTMYKF